MRGSGVPHREIVPTVPRLVALLTIAALASGCSLVFVKKAPRDAPEGAWVECSEGKVSPVVDVILGSTFLISALGISQVDDEHDELRNTSAAFYGIGGAALLYSAYVGFTETSRCGRLRDAAAARGIHGPYPPQPYPYPYPYPYPPPAQPYPYPAPPPQPPPAPPAAGGT